MRTSFGWEGKGMVRGNRFDVQDLLTTRAMPERF